MRLFGIQIFGPKSESPVVVNRSTPKPTGNTLKVEVYHGDVRPEEFNFGSGGYVNLEKVNPATNLRRYTFENVTDEEFFQVLYDFNLTADVGSIRRTFHSITYIRGGKSMKFRDSGVEVTV